MFKAVLCSTSEGQLVLLQLLLIIQFVLLKMSIVLLETCWGL